MFRSTKLPPLSLPFLLVIACTVMPCAASTPAATEDADAPSSSSGDARVIVKFKSEAVMLRRHALSVRAMTPAAAGDVLQRRAETLGARHGRTMNAGRGINERTQVVTASNISATELARQLSADADVEYAQVDHPRRKLAVPNDPLFGPAQGVSPASGQWYLKTPGGSGGQLSSIDAMGAWDVTTGTSSVVMAVLDTGVRTDHTDLAGRFVSGYDMVTSAAIANDGNGRDSDASDPGDYVTSADIQNVIFQGCSQDNSSWHGTMVAGLMGAASNNGVGMAGMSWNSPILPVRVLGKCMGYDSDIMAGVRWAAGLAVPGVPANPNPAKVLNLSLGGAGSCTTAYADTMAEVIQAGAVVVAAAGNESGHAVSAPANCPGVIAVTGVRHTGTKVGYANVGPEVALAAPAGNCVNETGECLYPILSTRNRGTQGPVAGASGSTYSDGLHYSAGTSFAAPMVAGTVALMFSANPELTPSQVKSLLQSSARPFPGAGSSGGVPTCTAPTGLDQVECHCTATTCGAGMLDAGAAVRAALALAASPQHGPLTADIAATPLIPAPNETVILSAARTQHDSGRTIASYSWSLLDGGGIVPGFIDSTTSVTASLRPTGLGTFTVGLTVTDDLGGVSTTQLSVAVTTLSVEVTTTPSSTVDAGTPVTFSLNNLQLSPDRSLAGQAWSVPSAGAGVSVLSGGQGSDSITVTPSAAGQFTVRLTVTDDLGKQAFADATVIVNASVTAYGADGTTGSTGSTGGSGGGALSILWSVGLLCATLSLAWMQRRPVRSGP